MHIYSIEKYKDTHKTLWNNFISEAKNGTFLFDRNFMDYHKARFEDHSLFVFNKNKLIAVLPANVLENTVSSHSGLTYGGLIFKENVRFGEAIQAYRAILLYMESQDLAWLEIKSIPKMYHKLPSDELDYIAFKTKAEITRCDTTSTINLNHRLNIEASNRKRGLKRALNQKLQLKEEDDLEAFWNLILIPNLEERHKTKPTHSLEEIRLLKSRFPKQIRQFNVYKEEKIVAGVTIFETQRVAHAQYISADINKQELGSLDFAFHELITTLFKEKSYFDFGISNENQGKNINEGLLNWKEDFGARTMAQPFYRIAARNHVELNGILL